MYFNADSELKFNHLDVIENASYTDVLMCLESATLISGELQANIETISAYQLFDQPANQNDNANNSTNNNSTATDKAISNSAIGNNADFWDKARIMSNKFFAVLTKIKDTIVAFIKNISGNISSVVQKLQAKIKSIGVEQSLIELKNNPKNYTYDQDYFNNKVSNAKFTNPLSSDLVKYYTDFINSCTDNLNKVKNNTGGNLTVDITKEGKEKIKSIENREVTGKDLATDAKMMYFSNNLGTCLPNVQGLYDSLDAKRAATIIAPVTQAANKFTSIADPLLKNTKISIDRATASKNANDYKRFKAGYDSLKQAMSLVAKMANECQKSMISMNISRLKIINTFIRLWRYKENNNNQNNTNQNNQKNNSGNNSSVDNDTKAP